MSRTSHPHGVWTNFRVVRTKDGQSLTELHNKTGISLGHLSDLENGRRLPTPPILKKLAKALNVPVSVLERKATPCDDGDALRDLIRQVVREELRLTGEQVPA